MFFSFFLNISLDTNDTLFMLSNNKDLNLRQAIIQAANDINSIKETLVDLDKQIIRNNIFIQQHENKIQELEREMKDVNKKIAYTSGVFAVIIYIINLLTNN